MQPAAADTAAVVGGWEGAGAASPSCPLKGRPAPHPDVPPPTPSPCPSRRRREVHRGPLLVWCLSHRRGRTRRKEGGDGGGGASVTTSAGANHRNGPEVAKRRRSGGWGQGRATTTSPPSTESAHKRIPKSRARADAIAWAGARSRGIHLRRSKERLF